MLGVNIATFCLAVIAIILRFTARRLTHAAFWWDDWLMLPAIVRRTIHVADLWTKYGQVFAAVMCFVSLTYMVDHGLGRHIWVAPMDAAVVWAKGLFISEVSYTIIICSIKFSLLAFYWRIFKQSKIRIPIYVLGAIVSCWGIAILITILQCQPVSDFWDRFAPAAKGPFHCGVNVNQFFNGNSIPNIITDAALLVLPMPFIWQLHLPKAQKVALTSVFILGIFVIGVSIARFTFIINLDLVSPDITWNFVNVQIWTGVESHVGIICGKGPPPPFQSFINILPACLPSLRPLLNLVLFGSIDRSHRCNPSDGKPAGGLSARSYNIWDTHIKHHQIGRGDNTSETTDNESNRGFARLPDEGPKGGTYITATNVALEDMHLNQGIQVRTDVYVDGQGKRNLTATPKRRVLTYFAEIIFNKSAASYFSSLLPILFAAVTPILKSEEHTWSRIRMTLEMSFTDNADPFGKPAGPTQSLKKRKIDDALPDDAPSGPHKTSKSCKIGRSSYVLNRNYAATTRLNSQHLLWKMELGWSLHPSLYSLMSIAQPASTTVSEDLTSTVTSPVQHQRPLAAQADAFRIADLATGTAIWPLDIAHSFPLVHIDGFDIDLQQCPPPDWLPRNVTLRSWDIFSVLAPGLEDSYDVVHIRLLLLVIRDNNPRPVLRNALRMLKAGGYLQWDELDPWGAYTVVPGKQQGDGAENGFQKKQELTAMSTLEWVLQLHSIMEEVGFENVRREEIACDLRLAKYYQDMQFLVMEEEAANKATAAEKDIVEEAIKEGVRDSRDGRARVTPKMVCLGRKPGPPIKERAHQSISPI
ncbi:MAG: hypothetical protein Q9181_005500 [Wetmoreana brouardii]